MKRDVSAVIAALPSRNALLGEALKSVYDQTERVRETCISTDTQRLGAARNRDAALRLASSTWVAMLDDDDTWLPQHVKALLDCAEETGADYVFSYFVRAEGGDPLGHFGKVFNPAEPHHTTVTTLVRRELAQDVGFFDHADASGVWSGEDWRFTLECVARGAKIVHHPEETWVWRRHSGNTSGLWGRGDAQ